VILERENEMTQNPSETCEQWTETEDNFRIFFDLCPDFLFVLNMEGGIILANRTVRTLLGYSNEELEGMSVLLLHPEDRREEAGMIVGEMVEGRRDFCPIPLLTRDGREVPVETRVVMGRWNGQPCLFGYSRNLMDQRIKEAERKLRESEERLQMILSGADLGTWDWDIPTGNVYFNPRWVEMLGYEAEEIKPHVETWEKLLHPEDADGVIATLQRHLEGKTETYKTEHRLRSKPGDWVWVLDTGRVIHRDAAGAPLRMAGIHMDITDRKQAESALHEYQEHLEELVRARTRQLEQAQKELLARAVEAGRVQTLDIMLHNIGNAVTPILLQADKLDTWNRDQPLKYLLACYRELRDHKGELDHYLAQNPRGMEVFSYMGRLLDTLMVEDRESTREAVSAIRSAVGHISHILKAQRLPSGAGEMKERMDVTGLVENALRIQGPALNKRGIRVRTQLAPGLMITVDQNSMMQVIMNLIKNAYEALDALDRETPKKEIFIRSYMEEKKVCLEISDSGIGLESARQPMVFETGVSEKGSSGFGLFYCRTIVEANGGTISFKSDGRGKGAAVRVAFEEDTLHSRESSF